MANSIQTQWVQQQIVTEGLFGPLAIPTRCYAACHLMTVATLGGASIWRRWRFQASEIDGYRAPVSNVISRAKITVLNPKATSVCVVVSRRIALDTTVTSEVANVEFTHIA